MLADGSSLAGSAITMLDAFRNLVSLGLSIPEASEMCSTRQAEYLDLSDFGRLAPGKTASFVVLDQALDLQEVWIVDKQRVGDIGRINEADVKRLIIQLRAVGSHSGNGVWRSV